MPEGKWHPHQSLAAVLRSEQKEAKHRVERYKQRGCGAKEYRPVDCHGAVIEIAPKSLAQAEGFDFPRTEIFFSDLFRPSLDNVVIL